jgi:hypothetical protein
MENNPISPTEMAVLIAHTLTTVLGLETDTEEGVITFTAGATGQRFALTATEVKS